MTSVTTSSTAPGDTLATATESTPSRGGASTPPLVVMGVSGSGKSTIGALLAEALEIRFVDGDDLHTDANREKMAAGHPLDDADREPWLQKIAQLLGDELAEGRPVVVACSALKRSYRDILRSQTPSLVFVHLAGSREMIQERQAARHHEYMPNSLLGSQFDALEPLGSDERGIVVELRRTRDEVVADVLDRLPEFA